MTELAHETKSWFDAIAQTYGQLLPVRNLLEIELRVGTLDLRHGHRNKVGKWDENMAMLDVAVSQPLVNVSFQSGLCIITRENVDRVIAESMLADDLVASKDETIRIKQIKSEQTMCYETPWESKNEAIAFLREYRHDRVPRSRLVKSCEETRVDTKYLLNNDLDVKLASFGMLGDLRMTAQVETTKEVTVSEAAELVLVNKSQNLHQRVRKRLIFDTTVGAEQGKWLMHRTQIETLAGHFVEHELEFELSPESLAELWAAWDAGNAMELIERIVDELVSLVTLCLASNPEPIRPILQPFDNVHCDLTLREQLSERLSKLTNNPHRRFAGSNPVAFEASQIPRVRSHVGGKPNYLVSEKSNGHRALFVLLRQQIDATECIPCIVTRDGHWHVRDDLPSGTEELVLDGELVFDSRLRRMTYIAFDIFAIENQCLISNTFETRQKVLATLNDRFGHSQSSSEMPIFIKEWVTPRQVYGTLERKMVTVRGGERMFDSNGMFHASDGYICQPTQTPFSVGTDINIFKYKTPQDLTLDLFVDVELLRKGHLRSPNLVYYTTTQNDTLPGKKRPRDTQTAVGMPCRIGSHETKLLLSKISADTTKTVAEFRRRNGHWEMLFVRSDKSRANAANTVQSTFAALQDHLTLREFLVGMSSSKCVVDQLAMQKMDQRTRDHLLHEE